MQGKTFYLIANLEEKGYSEEAFYIRLVNANFLRKQ
jgi:hypothetical protein